MNYKKIFLICSLLVLLLFIYYKLNRQIEYLNININDNTTLDSIKDNLTTNVNLFFNQNTYFKSYFTNVNLNSIVNLTFGNEFNNGANDNEDKPLDLTELTNLKTLEFGNKFNQKLLLPNSLTQLKFGNAFNNGGEYEHESKYDIVIPISSDNNKLDLSMLNNLTYIHFGDYFNQRIIFPSTNNIEELYFGWYFNNGGDYELESEYDIVIPISSDNNKLDLSNLTKLKKITFNGLFNQQIIFPSTNNIEELYFDWLFNNGGVFNYNNDIFVPIGDVNYKLDLSNLTKLKKLTFVDFNQQIIFPSTNNLEELYFGWYFNNGGAFDDNGFGILSDDFNLNLVQFNKLHTLSLPIGFYQKIYLQNSINNCTGCNFVVLPNQYQSSSIEYSYLPNIDYSNHDIINRTYTKISDCKNLCNSNTSCRSFVDDKNNKKCYFKNNDGTSWHNTSDNELTDLYIKSPNSMEYTKYENKDFGGYDSYQSDNISDISQCKTNCNNNDCTGFVLEKNENKCWFKNYKDYVESSNIDFYIKPKNTVDRTLIK